MRDKDKASCCFPRVAYVIHHRVWSVQSYVLTKLIFSGSFNISCLFPCWDHCIEGNVFSVFSRIYMAGLFSGFKVWLRFHLQKGALSDHLPLSGLSWFLSVSLLSFSRSIDHNLQLSFLFICVLEKCPSHPLESKLQEGKDL